MLQTVSRWHRPLICCVLLLFAGACQPTSSTAGARLPASVEQPARAVALDGEIPRPSTDLIDTDGAPFDLASATAGRPALVMLGYTSCPDICPVHLSTIARALDELGLRAGRDLDVVFVGVDPSRDTPARIEEFIDHFDPDFLGATGDAAQLAALADDLGLPRPIAEDPGDGTWYPVEHPAQVMVFGPDGPAEAQVPFGARAGLWVDLLPALIGGRTVT